MLNKVNDKVIFNTLFAGICLVIFLIMLWCNMHTPLLCDDFRYLFTFSTDGPIKRVDSFAEIFPSMAAHRIQMNGRVFPHFIVQLSLILPLQLFDITNSVIFLVSILLIYKCTSMLVPEKQYAYKLLLLCSVFAAIWIFQPNFGQVNLWQDGALNYLWGAALSLGFIYLFLGYLLNGKRPSSIAGIIGCTVLSLANGAWSENAAGALIIFAAILIAYMIVIKKQNIHWSFWLYIAALVVGFAYMVSAPAEFTAKVSEEISLLEPIWRLPRIFFFCKSFWPLWIAAVVMLTVAAVTDIEQDLVFVCAVLVLCAVAACVCLTLGTYVAGRSFFFTVVSLVLVCALLSAALLRRCKAQVFSLLVVVLICLPEPLLLGIIDIGNTERQVKQSEETIMAAVYQGEDSVDVSNIFPETKYSALYELLYISEDLPKRYPNNSMAKYYGIESIY